MSLGLCRNNYRNRGVTCRNTSFFKPQAASLLLVLRLQPPTQQFELLLSVTKISATDYISILCNHIQHNYKIILNIWPAGIKTLFVLITYPRPKVRKILHSGSGNTVIYEIRVLIFYFNISKARDYFIKLFVCQAFWKIR